MNKKLWLTFIIILMTGIAVKSYGQLPPSLIAPNNVATCITVSPTLEWTPMQNAVDYRVQVADTSDFSYFVLDTDGVVTSTLTINLPKNSTIYYWRVTVNYPGNGHGTSTPYQFTTRRKPPMASIPVDASTCMDKSLTIKWLLDGSTFYRLQISDKADFSHVIVDRNNIAADSLRTIVPDYGTQYYWHVSSTLNGCESDWSLPMTFTTKTGPPAIIFPSDSAKGADVFSTLPLVVKLKWNRIPTVDSYDLQLGSNAFLDSLDYDLSGLVDTNLIVNLDTRVDSMYFWRVRSVKDGCKGDWSRVYVFNTPYINPTPALPHSNETCVHLRSAKLSWSFVPKAKGYRIKVSDNILFAASDIDTKVIDSSNATVSLVKPFTKYYWKVRADDDRNTGLWSNIDSFETSQIPPDLYFPKNDTAGVPAAFTLVWQRLADTSIYNIQVSESPNFAASSLLIDSTGLDTNKLTLMLPKNDFIYYWRVQAVLGDCESDWSNPFHFRTLITYPALISPSHNSANKSIYPIFVWHPIPTAVNYDIQLTKDSTFANVLKSRVGIGDTLMSFAGEPLEEDARYFWRVRSVNDDGKSVWSPYFAFNTGILPANQPQLISPANGSTKIDTSNVDLLWHKVSNAKKYIVQLAYSAEFSEVFKQYETTDTTQTLTGLTNYTYYYWRVRSANDSGDGSWSVVWFFRTIAKPISVTPTLIAPDNNLQFEGNYTTLQWQATPNALGYRVIISKTSDFSADTVFYTAQLYEIQKVIFNLPYNVTYYWKVQAWNEVNESPWSEVWNFTTKIPASVIDEALARSLTIQPQPADDHIMLNFDVDGLKKSGISIYNIQGNLIMEYDLGMIEGSRSFNINTSNLTPGAYMVRLTTGDAYAVKMISVVR